MTSCDPSYRLLSSSHSVTPVIPSSARFWAQSDAAVGHTILGTFPHSSLVQPADTETPLRPAYLLK